MREALGEVGAGSVTFAQCALGAQASKYTTIAYAHTLVGQWAELEAAQCVHGLGGHTEVAHGRDDAGERRARSGRQRIRRG
eukprot:2701535-Pleurochrysis_carterae.AAC.1